VASKERSSATILGWEKLTQLLLACWQYVFVLCAMERGRTKLTNNLQFINEQQITLNKARDDHDWDALANAPPPPRVNFWITQSHLVSQAAIDAAEFSSVFDVRVYGGEKEKETILPHGIQRQGPALSQDSKLFDPANPLTRHILFVTTYETFAARHGPNAAAQYMVKASRGRITLDSARVSLVNDNLPSGWLGNLDGLVGLIVQDECQRQQNYNSQSSTAVRWANPVFNVLLTATPVPWAASSFAGLLAFLDDPETNLEAEDIVKACKDDRPDPKFMELYTESCDPAYKKYRCTHAAFSYLMQDSLSLYDQGRILGYNWEATMLRRTYLSSCVTHPNGDVHYLGNLLPSSLAVRITIENEEHSQRIYDEFGNGLKNKLYSLDKATQMMRINGRIQRQLNLASFCPILFWAKSMVKVNNNTFMNRQCEFRDDGKYAEYLHRILQDVYDESTKADHAHILPTEGGIPPPQEESGSLAFAFVARSERIRMIIGAVADFVVAKGEKVIIFYQNPTEQEILISIFNILGFKSEAHMSRYDTYVKRELVERFNRPLARNQSHQRNTGMDDEIEILLLSIHQNTGLNLQYQCCKVILTGPAKSNPGSLHCCGRVARIGQSKHCTIIEFYDPNTYNHAVMVAGTRKALPSLARFLNPHALAAVFGMVDEDSDEDTLIASQNLTGFVLVDGELRHKRSEGFPEEHRNDDELGKRNKQDCPGASILPGSLTIVKRILTNILVPSDVLLHLFNSTRGTEYEVKVDAKDQSRSVDGRAAVLNSTHVKNKNTTTSRDVKRARLE
jgi:hypothetical protein